MLLTIPLPRLPLSPNLLTLAISVVVMILSPAPSIARAQSLIALRTADLVRPLVLGPAAMIRRLRMTPSNACNSPFATSSPIWLNTAARRTLLKVLRMSNIVNSHPRPLPCTPLTKNLTPLIRPLTLSTPSMPVLNSQPTTPTPESSPKLKASTCPPNTSTTLNPPRVRGGVYYVKIQDPSSVSRGVIRRLRFDPEAVLESCRTLRPGRRSRCRIRHGA
mmetsp:Transcript_60204/g.125949  ORF Transcript_60204/g.125949 Transcript_60204/m.125949 type:complete len:219 (+) Transcript_60204:3005-3661(+)